MVRTLQNSGQLVGEREGLVANKCYFLIKMGTSAGNITVLWRLQNLTGRLGICSRHVSFWAVSRHLDLKTRLRVGNMAQIWGLSRGIRI